MPRARLLRVSSAALVAAMLLSAPQSVCSAQPAHIVQSPEELKYQFREASAPSITPFFFKTADFDSNGVDEMVKVAYGRAGTARRQLVSVGPGFERSYTQVNYPLDGCVVDVLDLDGDGKPEIIDWRQNTDGTVTLSVISVSIAGERASEEILGRLSWDVSPWLRANGIWAGNVQLICASDEDGNGTRESLVMSVFAGISLEPRGIWKGNWETSTFSWQLPTGGIAEGNLTAADLDGDGRDEFVVGVESPNNGVRTPRWDDSHGYVVAISPDGGILWDREVAGRSAQIYIAVADLDGDGHTEVCTAVLGYGTGGSGSEGVIVWRGIDGERLARLPLGCDATDLFAMETSEGPRLYASGEDGIIRRLSFAGDSLLVERRVDCGHGVIRMGTVRFEPELEDDAVLALVSGGGLVLLDQSLNPLALLLSGDTGTDNYSWLSPATFEVSGGHVHGALVSTGTALRKLYLTRSPMKTRTKAGIFVVAALALLIGVPPSRNASLATLRRAVLPRSERSALVDGLLTALNTAGHGRLAATSTFRRLSRQMEMVSGVEAPPEALQERFTQAARNVREIGIPGLRDIRAQANRLGLAPRATSSLASALTSAEKMVNALPDAMPRPEAAGRLRYRLDGVLKPIEDELLTIRRAAERERSVELIGAMKNALDAREPEIAARQIEVNTRGLDAGDELRVLSTPLEAGFILENLLGNAVEAVKEEHDRRIDLVVTVQGQYAVVTFSDTGCGIPESRREAIFTPGVSSREGGGHGLSRSREILGKRGGTIRLLRSEPGQGTTFEVKFRLCC